MRTNKPTLYPSFWRDGGCGSHFIIWRGQLLWCDRFEEGKSSRTSTSSRSGGAF
ncbi:DUF6527 family protein [Bradyrhizobium sp. CCBAU 11386]|uniref:DUF6527 family protein n=1 Tax=Bradyrhizobium sp. CCBAU 11386 TaxID=1630837 RepID=UPI003FA4C622